MATHSGPLRSTVPGSSRPSRAWLKPSIPIASFLLASSTNSAWPSLPMPWKRPVATMPTPLDICGTPGTMCGGAGWWTSSFQKTSEVVAYHCSAAPPIIGVAALLRLAGWCQQRRVPHGGSPLCPSHGCPPIDSPPPLPPPELLTTRAKGAEKLLWKRPTVSHWAVMV